MPPICAPGAHAIRHDGLPAASGVRLLCLVVATLFASYFALALCATFQKSLPHPLGDSFALWSYGQILRQGDATRLYDFDALHAAQVAMGIEPWTHNPFPYPPIVIPFLYLSSPLDYPAACVLWLAAGCALYVAVTRTTAFGTWLALLAPTTTVTIMAGQAGFLVAFLLVGGLRLRTRRPWLAGFLFGLLTCKPQFGLMVPVVLLATRDWRTMTATCSTVAALAFGTTMLLGPAIWVDWLTSLPRYQAWFETLTVRHFEPTVTMNLQLLGVPHRVASAAQAGVAVAAAAWVWWACRRFAPALAVPVALLATCLATPHALVYDLPLLTAAVVVAIDARRGQPIGPVACGVILLVLVFPAAMAFGCTWPLASMAYAGFAAVLCRWGAVRSAAHHGAPEIDRFGFETA